MKTNMKKAGISLIVLVITIIIMIILAATIIISLNNTGIIGAAENAVCKTNIKQAQNLAVLTWSNIYTKPDEYTLENIEEKLKEEFEENGLVYEDYNVEVTKNGIDVSSKAGCVDSSGVEGGNAGSDVPPTNWEYAYIYDASENTWIAIETNDGTEPTGKEVVKFYKLEGETVSVSHPDIDDEVITTAYKMIVNGSGEFDMNVDDLDKIIKVYIKDDSRKAIMELVKYAFVEEGITILGNTAFAWYYSQAEEITLPVSLKQIEAGCLEGCDSLKIINYRGTQAQWQAINGIENIPSTVNIVYDYTGN